MSKNIIYSTPSIGMCGFFSVDLIDAATGIVKQALAFPNVLTDAFMNAIGAGTFNLDTAFTFLQVGAGSAIPTFSDTNLQIPIGTRTNFNGGIAPVIINNTTPEYTFRRITRVFLENQANGNLTELGFFNTATGGILANRALFRDSAGNTTTIFKTPSDILRVQFELRLFAPQFDVINTVQIGTQPVTITIRPQRVQDVNGWGTVLTTFGAWGVTDTVAETDVLQIRTATNTPTGNTSAIDAQLLAYVNGTFHRDIEFNATPIQGNFPTGLGLLVYSPFTGSPNLWQVQFSPKIPKTLQDRFIIRLRQSWSRV